MIVLLVLFGSFVCFRLLGFVGVPWFQSWHESMVFALAVMFCFTGLFHFGRMRADLERMVPPWVPKARMAVFVTGILEILGGIGLIIPETRTLAGVCLIVFLVAVFPANVYAAKTGARFGDRAVTPLGVRGPMQLLFIVLLFWAISE
jgi:uncharacterized membrane protein